jgi:hypothetical protein
MDTDDLLRTLAADNDWRATPTGTALLIALFAAAPISLAIFLLALGVRPDFAVATHNPFFDLKFVVALALATSAVAVVLPLSRPGAALGVRPWLLLVPVALLATGIACDLAVAQDRSWSERLVGTNSRVCLSAIPAMALPLLVAALVGLRQGASTRPALSGAAAGLLCGGLAATVYAAHCTDDSPLFVATWYSIGIAGLTVVGAAAGSRLLRI